MNRDTISRNWDWFMHNSRFAYEPMRSEYGYQDFCKNVWGVYTEVAVLTIAKWLPHSTSAIVKAVTYEAYISHFHNISRLRDIFEISWDLFSILGIRAPTRSITGTDLPLARAVSYTMFPNRDINDKIWSLLSMQYGQIMAHDMGLIDGTTQSSTYRALSIRHPSPMSTNVVDERYDYRPDKLINEVMINSVLSPPPSLFTSVSRDRRITQHAMLHVRRPAGTGHGDDATMLPDTHTARRPGVQRVLRAMHELRP